MTLFSWQDSSHTNPNQIRYLSLFVILKNEYDIYKVKACCNNAEASRDFQSGNVWKFNSTDAELHETDQEAERFF